MLGLMLFGFSLVAQNKVKVELVDETSGEPVGFATVSIVKDGQTKPLKYALTDEKGKATIESVKKGAYTLKAELMGYITYTAALKMESADVDLGTIKMKLDAEVIDAASVSATGNPVIIKKDTVEYTASAFKTTDNDVLEDLLKKLPGVEVSEDGTITANGQTINKITVDGKTFFLDDPQMASKNIPAKMVEKLKVIQKKSEQAEFTGIDDGQEETVIDLSVNQGMMRGLIGQVSGGAGADVPSQSGVKSDARYTGNAFVGSFKDDTQLSLILNANNTNNRGATNRSGNMMMVMMGGGGGMGRGQGGWGGGNGITTSYLGGFNAAGTLLDDKMEIGGNYIYNYNRNDVEESSRKTTYLQDKNVITNSEGLGNTISGGHSFGMRLEHKFSKNTSILFMPQVTIGTGSYLQTGTDETLNDDLSGNVFKVNDSYTDNTGDNKNLSASGRFLLRQRLGIPGRTLTFNADASVSNNVLNGLNNNGITSYTQTGDIITTDEVKQSFENTANSYSASGTLTYTEPMGNYFYLEANYSYNWNKSVSDKQTIDLFTSKIDYDYSNKIINETNRQQIGANVLYQSDKLRAQVGFSAIPTRTFNSTTKYDPVSETYAPREYDDFRWNFSPQAMVSIEPNDNFNGRLFYRGNSSQPSTSQLMPVPDNTNPLFVSFGNPSLTPYFTHNIRIESRYSNRAKFASANIRLNGGFTQNPIVNATWYGTNGAQYSMPFNGPTTANAGANMFFNFPIGKTNFSVNNTLGMNWRKSSSYVGTGIDMSIYDDPNKGYYDFMEWFIGQFNDPAFYEAHITLNKTQSISANERLRLQYRGKSLEVTAGASTRMNKTWYSISTSKDQTTTWNNQVSASLTYDWSLTGMSFEGEMNYNWYNGYATAQPSQCVFNASIAKTINNFTISLNGYDILGQSKNLTVTDSGNYHTEAVNNTLGRYVILSVSWRFGSMGRPGAGGHRPDRRGGPAGPGGPAPGGMPGGPGGPMI